MLTLKCNVKPMFKTPKSLLRLLLMMRSILFLPWLPKLGGRVLIVRVRNQAFTAQQGFIQSNLGIDYLINQDRLQPRYYSSHRLPVSNLCGAFYHNRMHLIKVRIMEKSLTSTNIFGIAAIFQKWLWWQLNVMERPLFQMEMQFIAGLCGDFRQTWSFTGLFRCCWP